EDLVKIFKPCKVIGIALWTEALEEQKVRTEIERIESELHIPTTDVVRYGPDKLVNAIIEHFAEEENIK
ncbi:MAG: DUF1611 domain-containing protein, partial [Fidelibacterota bacterium]